MWDVKESQGHHRNVQHKMFSINYVGCKGMGYIFAGKDNI